MSPLEQLGKSVFFDRRLSLRGNQSCASCHAPQVGWTGDLPLVNAGPAIYEGSVSGLFSNRKPPTVAYAMAPVFHATTEDGEMLFVGGNFWDGRATGERLGDPIAEQAQGPFVNPVEQALPDTGCVVRRVCAADYPVTLEEQFPGSCGIAWPPDLDGACALPVSTLPTFAKAYMHNGYFKTLSGLVHFYNTRDVKPACGASLTEREALARDCWPAPEVIANVNTDELGNLGLSQAEERAIVAFMGTLSDGYAPAAGQR